MKGHEQVTTVLGPTIWQFTARLWQTNSVLVAADGHALVFDPTLTPREVSTIREQAEQVGGDRHVFVTHSHFDHVCGIPAFPDAEVVAGEDTAAAVAGGSAGEKLRSAAEEWGIAWSSELRVDRTVSPTTELRFGGTRVLAVEATGNAADGLAYVLPNEGLLVAGDFIQPANYPCPGGAATRETYRRLLSVLDREPIEWVISGHGPALTALEARELAAADLAYMHEVCAVADEVTAADLSPREAQLAVYAVVPPRKALDSFEIYDQRNIVAWCALREAREGAGRTSAASEPAWQRLLAGAASA